MSARPLRICFVAYRGNMQCGGQGVYLWFLARELARLGHRIEVVVGPPYPDPMPFAEAVSRAPNDMYWGKWFARNPRAFTPQEEPLRALRPLHFYELAASRLGFLPEPFAFSLRALARLAARLRAGVRYDLVHDVQCLGYGLLALRALGLPVVTTVHHPLTVDRRTSFQRDQSLVEAVGTMQFYPVGMQAFVAKRLDAVFTSSGASAALLRRDFGVSPARIIQVGNGLDTELFSPEPNTPREARRLLCVGRAADPNKGIATLLEAFAKLPADVRLTLVDAPDSDALRWAERLGCAERLDLAGRVSQPELIRLYRSAALVVVPSRFEGFGLPAVEAMACGTPVVATRAGALPEVMARGGGGLVVPRDDPAALAAALQQLLDAPERRAQLGAAARSRVADAYGWPRVAEKMAEHYRALIAARRAGAGAKARNAVAR